MLRTIADRPLLSATVIHSRTRAPRTVYSSTAPPRTRRTAVKRPSASDIGPRPTSVDRWRRLARIVERRPRSGLPSRVDAIRRPDFAVGFGQRRLSALRLAVGLAIRPGRQRSRGHARCRARRRRRAASRCRSPPSGRGRGSARARAASGSWPETRVLHGRASRTDEKKGKSGSTHSAQGLTAGVTGGCWFCADAPTNAHVSATAAARVTPRIDCIRVIL